MNIGFGEPADFWRGRKVLLTGHTGFKGSWMYLWLQRLGADVTGYALAPIETPSLWRLIGSKTQSVIGDIRDRERVSHAVIEANPHIVIHMAAQALVKESYKDPLGTYETNVIGTANVLQACRSAPNLECAVIVTSDKVYDNNGAGRPFEEADRLGGHDPYSNSKACTELVASSFRDSFFENGPPIATARAGNVIGGGDWSPDRLIPDCVRALSLGRPVTLRYPDAIRPWQHVLEPLSGYLTLAQALVARPKTFPLAVNFGPDPQSFLTVSKVVEAFSSSFDGLPGWQPDGASHPAEAQALTLSSAEADRRLGWRPKLSIVQSLSWTADWYRAFAIGKDMSEFTKAQLAQYEKL